MPGEGGTSKGRAAALALGLLVLVTVPLLVWGSSGGEGGGDELVVRFEPAQGGGPVQIVVALREDGALGDATPREQPSVECRDAGGETVVRAPAQWPLDTDGGTLAPHTHVNATPAQAERVHTCALLGLGRPLEGRVR